MVVQHQEGGIYSSANPGKIMVVQWLRTCVFLVAATCCVVEATTRPEHQASTANDILARYPGQDDYISPTKIVWAAVGSPADLFCNLTSPIPGDPALLVLWYKNGIHKPIYSYDVRNRPASHWQNPSHFKDRAVFNDKKDSLSLKQAQAEDQGTYRCRVDFRTNPTLTFTTNLTVIVPPRRLAVYTDMNVEARRIVGPYLEGEDLRLTCRAFGGSPPPRVTWWEGALLLDLTPEVETMNQVANTLVIQSLSRRDLNRALTCHAQNSNLTEPLTTMLTLDMNFPPLWVRFERTFEALSANVAYSIVCESAGSRPPPLVTWRLHDTILTTHTETTSQDGNLTTSELKWTPTVGDVGKVLSCQAESEKIAYPPLIVEWHLDIYYTPITILKPGKSLNLSNIEEGDDVYFECSIQSNPWVYKIIWLHELRELHHNVSAGVIISNQSLVLQRVTRAATGNYYCVASNVEGDGKSNPILLRVKYSPVCRNEQMTYHGAARYEQVNIPCELDAFPQPHSFRWTFNNSGESVEIPQTKIHRLGSRSTVSYTPNTELDYGTLLCWGTNSVGLQRHPCVFHVFPADSPVCRNEQMTYHGAARYEQVNIPCELDAFPQPHSFRWTFNNSGESVEIPQTKIHRLGSRSTVSYTPNTELDYGTLLCWGTNSVGLQRHPCVFHVFPAGRPDPVHNCSGFNLSETVVNVRCVAGFDGGLPQTFVLELYEPHTNVLVANATSMVPRFIVGGLQHGMTFTAVVYSSNGKGRGEMVSFKVYTLKDVAEKRTAAVKPPPTRGSNSEQMQASGIIAVVLGALGGLLVVGILICAVVRVRYMRREERQRRGGCGRAGVRDTMVSGQEDVGGACQAKTTATGVVKEFPPPPASPRDADEKNPDVIPLSDSDSWNMEVVNTISTASLPSTYVTLPRSSRGCSHDNYQQACGSTDVQYAELLLSGAVATPGPHPRNPRHVVYATLDAKTQHSHFPPQHSQPAYPRPVSATNTPTHVLHHQHPPTTHALCQSLVGGGGEGHHHPQQHHPLPTGHPQGSHCPWTTATATLPRRHSLRRDPTPRDAEDSVPLMTSQKESSV
ncbi:nephrin-like [Penaeus japonicus]|uniref:nephrin-like n=1 Tax=Penaeus japonicus TaxID=27405 RepID=UPI001C7126AE|nr:nephrin-like [Penaeus japonicus]